MINNFIFTSLFRDFISFPLFLDFIECLGWYLCLFKEI